MEQQPSYYSILPANVRYDQDLSANEKLLYGEITALCGKTGECWAKNKYFADLYGVSDRAVRGWISHLVAKGYLEMDMNDDGNERKLRLPSAPQEKNILPPQEKNFHHNIINPYQYSDNSNSTGVEDEIVIALDGFVDGWNTKLCGNCPKIAKIEVFNNARRSKLKARLREAKRYMIAHGGTGDLLTYVLRDVIYDRYSNSQFLRGEVPGRNGTGSFRMDINHILRPEFFAKMLEHRYDDRPQYRTYDM